MLSVAFRIGMELKQLRVLQAVGETGSFSAAADRLDYTQSAVSKIVATLERQLGTTLVDRGIRPIRLTEAGSAHKPEAISTSYQRRRSVKRPALAAASGCEDVCRAM